MRNGYGREELFSEDHPSFGPIFGFAKGHAMGKSKLSAFNWSNNDKILRKRRGYWLGSEVTLKHYYCVWQIQTLYSLCPQEGHQATFKMDQRAQDSIIALGIYLLESDFQHVDHILPYLLKLLHGLGKMQWVDEIKYFPRESLFIFFT